MPEPMLATPANMRHVEALAGRVARSDVFAYSPGTGERYSATPGDYFMRADDDPLRDANGEPMILAFEVNRIVPVLDINPPREAA